MGNEIWRTLGPASLNDRVISWLEELGVSLFRLNLSHTIRGLEISLVLAAAP